MGTFSFGRTVRFQTVQGIVNGSGPPFFREAGIGGLLSGGIQDRHGGQTVVDVSQ